MINTLCQWQGLILRCIADFSEALKLRPQFAEAFYNRGLAYAELKDMRAVEDFAQVIELSHVRNVFVRSTHEMGELNAGNVCRRWLSTHPLRMSP